MATVAAAQLRSTPDWEVNLANAQAAVDRAAGTGARLVVIPELYSAWRSGTRDIEGIRPLAQAIDGPFVSGLSAAASAAGIWIICGTIESGRPGDERARNTTVVLDARGRLVATYGKTHLYDAFGWSESGFIHPGDRLFEPIDTPIGRIGLMVCYELRFPEVARTLVDRGADVLIVPSAWVRGPGKELHWRTLATARAIENTVYVVAADQVGNDFIGQSLILDPLGTTLADAGDAETVITAVVDPEIIAAARETVPSLRHRRPELYTAAPAPALG